MCKSVRVRTIMPMSSQGFGLPPSPLGRTLLFPQAGSAEKGVRFIYPSHPLSRQIVAARGA